MRRAALVVGICFLAACAQAQALKSRGPAIGDSTTSTAVQGAPGKSATMAELLTSGYEIKASVPNGGKFIVFMQKAQSAYACEFASLSNTRCGALN